MKRWVHLILRGLAGSLGLLLLLGVILAGWFYFQLRSSRAQLDGSAPLAGLGAAVTVERDALGIPTIQGEARADVFRALGYLHAQDRFFQMDLMRRQAAGELSALIGQPTVAMDRRVRVHGFRARAQQALTLDTPENRAFVTAYTAGVNAGLAALGAKPFEYVALRSTPEPWLPEDSYLIGYAMALTLQESDGRTERTFAALRNHYGPVVAAFFAPLQTPTDAALDGSRADLPPIPPPQLINLRRRTAPAPTAAAATPEDLPVIGSNTFALAGPRTVSGAGLLANDMHLEHGVPNTWYRASLVTAGQTVSGLTLPGAPGIIVGSNGRVAWGFTHSYADTSDVVLVELNSISRLLYRQGTENLEFERRREIITVRGDQPVEFEVENTVWGPVIAYDDKEQPLVYRWVLHEPGAINFSLLDMADATTAAEALAVTQRVAIPTLNIVIADAAGEIAWTIAGPLPQRVGFDGRFPVAWTYGDRRWTGLLPVEMKPVVQSPADGVLWNANNRMLGGEALTLIGDGGFAAPERAGQIRDQLTPLTAATPADLLAIQLDDRALFLERWQQLLLRVLTSEVTANHASREALRAAVESWEGRAAVDSTSYRLVHAFRQHTGNLVFTPIFASCVRREPVFNWRLFRYEEPLWQLLHQQPEHLLNPQFADWKELLVAAADAVLADLKREKLSPDQATWGKRNTANIRHPLGAFLPRWLTGWLDLPADPLPGDINLPRAQSPRFGASNRMVVAPGREAEGIMHLPAGQSGHPLSPFYRAGHEAWVRGEPTPFLPGATQHTLTLTPEQR